MGDNYLHVLQSKVDDMDRILGCFVCSEQLLGDIQLCTEGHPVCQKCRINVLKCPLCDSRFTGTRDYLAENMMSKFEEIKDELKNLAYSSRICSVEAEKFSCPIKYCTETLSYIDMIGHIHFIHENILINKGVVKSDTFIESFKAPYVICTEWERIIYVQNMGIFFIEMKNNSAGNVYGYVRSVTSLNDTETFFYKLEIEHPDHDNLFIEGPVRSIKSPRRSHCRSLSLEGVPVVDTRFFKCTIKITRIQ